MRGSLDVLTSRTQSPNYFETPGWVTRAAVDQQDLPVYGKRGDHASDPAAAAAAKSRPKPTNQEVTSRFSVRYPIELPMSA